MAAAAPDFFSDALRREIIRSERERMRAVAIILASLLALALGVANLFPSYTSRIFERDVPGWLPFVGVGPFLLYELGSLTFLGYRASKGQDFPQYARFGNALIETSLPSAIIITLSHYMDPLLVFGFWPPLLYFIFILLSTLRLDFWLSVWTGSVAAVQQMVLVLWLLPIQPWGDIPQETLLFHFSRTLVLFTSGLVAGFVANSLRSQFEKSVRAVAARDRVTNLFGQHVSPAVVDRLLATQSEPPSEIRTVCVLFLDIRGFTAMTRRRSAEETVALLNAFFARMIDVVDRNNGIINKFLGDGFLALFGAPLADPAAARNALAAAQEMIDTVAGWNDAHPGWALRVGIGIHLGEAVTGTVGSPQRKEYTVIGDTVNLAARLEQLTKEMGAQLLVSQSVLDAAPCDGAVDLGPVAIRGYDEKVRVWRIT
ncbi:adenylate/guanylate cyclase domain-containing protein [uncultured Reyranella sp.]|uniref:adenylate/guanylate cyclase domain-containing protein n=1 Tax=uncultured Reyranella sp. TaxID=735512 RepID=UPI00259CB22B|nr:adenylate/guanylate cyclase domain-containing protein [uncultured Reyranella sp.]